MVNLKWYLLCLLPIGLIAVNGCSPPEPTATVSQVDNNPPAFADRSEPAAGEPAVQQTAPADRTGIDGDGSGGANSSDESRDERAPAPVNNASTDPPAMPESPAESGGASVGRSGDPRSEDEKSAADPTADESASDDSDKSEEDLTLPEFPGPSGKKGTEVGDLIPEIDGKDLDKVSFKLSDYSGRVVMLDFWGDW